MKQIILTVVGKDHPGIIAGVTGILFKRGSNLEDISMTLLEGEFAMVLVLNPKNAKSAAQLKADLTRMTKQKKDLSFYWKEAKSRLKRGEKHLRGSKPYLISAFGKDRTGIVYKTSKLLSERKINITDLNSRILGSGAKTLYMMLLEADIPKSASLAALTRALQKLAKQLKVEIQIKPVETLNLV